MIREGEIPLIRSVVFDPKKGQATVNLHPADHNRWHASAPYPAASMDDLRAVADHMDVRGPIQVHQDRIGPIAVVVDANPRPLLFTA